MDSNYFLVFSYATHTSISILCDFYYNSIIDFYNQALITQHFAVGYCEKFWGNYITIIKIINFIHIIP